MMRLQCDGALPCNRCREDNMVCLFGERDKSQDKTWPRGTVELQQKVLTIYEEAIIQLYQRSLSGCSWSCPPVPHSGDGRPLIHAILASLGACQQNCTYFREVDEKIGRHLNQEASLKPIQRSLKKEGDLDVKVEFQESWPEVTSQPVPQRAQPGGPMPQGTSYDAPYPPSPPRENPQQQAAVSGQRTSTSTSPQTRQERRSNHTSLVATQMTLPTPNLTPDTEKTPQVSSSSFGPFAYPTNASQNNWPYSTAASSSGNFPSYQTTPMLGAPALYDDTFSEAQGYGWPGANNQLIGDEQTLLATMMDPSAPQNHYAFSEYPFES